MQVIPSALMGLALSSTAALALQIPEPGKNDARMQTVIYQPGQVYHLQLPIGRTVAVVLPDDEKNNEKYGSDSKHIQADVPANSNMIFLKATGLKSTESMPSNSFFVHAHLADGSERLYPFEITIVPSTEGIAVASLDKTVEAPPPAPYVVTFKDPQAIVQANAIAAQAWRKKRDEKAATAALLAAANSPVDTNFSYILQGKTAGDWGLLPTRQVGDDGTSTHFYFPGQSAPIVYTVSSDGHETVADCVANPTNHITTCHQLSRQWRLRDGDSELCAFNHAYQAVATETPSNTASPSFERTLKDTP